MISLLRNCILVGVGGFVGSVVRYSFSLSLQRYSVVVPMGTLMANLVGCFLIGIIAQMSMLAGLLTPEARLVLAVGFCGGLTTASTMIYETAQFLSDGEYFHAGGYVVGTVIGSMFAFFLGVVLIKIILKSTGGLWN
jgi:fluoride exporter